MYQSPAACLILAFLLSIIGPRELGAQESSSRTIVGSGTVTIKQMPSVFRMTVELREKDQTIDNALQMLADRQEAARLQLETLGAKADDIVITPASLPAEDSDMQRQMRQMAMLQMRSRGRVPAGLKPVKSVTVTSTVTAEWPITMETNEKLLVFVSSLRDKIVDADLAGRNEPKELTPEEEEMQAEMAEMTSQYSYMEEGTSPGEPAFMYVATLSNEQRAEAMAQAFQKAKTQAQLLADAAGVKLGRLNSLRDDSGIPDSLYARQYMQYAMAMGGGGAVMGDTQENESVSPTPGPIPFQIVVGATFEIE